MAFQFLNVNELLKCSVLRNFTSSLIEARVSGIIAKKIFKLKTAFLLPSPSYLLNSPIDSWRIFSLKLSLPRESFLPGKHKLLLKMTCFFLLKCQESEEHVIPQMTTLKKFQLPLRHAHGSHAARAAYSPEQYVFQNLCFFGEILFRILLFI